jgi:hypothetical protein
LAGASNLRRAKLHREPLGSANGERTCLCPRWVRHLMNDVAVDEMPNYRKGYLVLFRRLCPFRCRNHCHRRENSSDNASNAALLRPGGTAITTQYVADLEALQASGVRGLNFAPRATSDLLDRVGKALADRTIVGPPMTRVRLNDVPGLFRPQAHSHADGKTVIVL